jgi:hypothetical protein
MRRLPIIMMAIAIAASITVGTIAQTRVVPSQIVIDPKMPPRPPIPRGTSAIRGRIFDSVTKAPVAGCTVRAGASGNFGTRVSDQNGAYEFNDIAAGEYAFLIQCPSHLAGCFGMDLPGGLCQIEVVRDQQRDGIDFYLRPGAIARGRVVAFDGRPIPGANVRMGRGIHGEASQSNTRVATDSDGRFELTNLHAGEWRLEVEIPPVPGGLPPPVVYYPGGLSWEDAAGVELIAGRVTDNLTITVPRINENTLIVAVPPADATISEVAVSVLQQSPLVTRRLTLNAEGIGMLKAILPGRYFALALASSGDKRWAGFEVIDFVEDTYEARLQLQPTGSIAGKIVGDRGAPPDLDGVIVGASWVHDGAEVNPVEFAEARVAADGSFRIDGLFGTRRLQLRALGTDWEVAAVRQDRIDVTESGISIVPDATIEATIVVRRRGALYD